jgi:predicted O-methyltransferase YrrM
MLLTSSKRVRTALGALETFSFLSIKLWLRSRKAARRFAGKSFRLYMSLAGSDQWRSAPIDEILGLDNGRGIRIQMEHMAGVGVYNPVDELAYLALLTRQAAPDRIFEIGTYRGRTALNFALNSPESCKIHTLDLPPQERSRAQGATNEADALIIASSETGVDYRGKPGAEKIHQLYGDSLRFDFSPYLGRMDIAFVDGAHHYDAVKSDTNNALRMVRPGGWVIWHDFACYGDYNDVTRAVLDLLPGNQIVQIADSQLACYRKPVNL